MAVCHKSVSTLKRRCFQHCVPTWSIDVALFVVDDPSSFVDAQDTGTAALTAPSGPQGLIGKGTTHSEYKIFIWLHIRHLIQSNSYSCIFSLFLRINICC